jgi:hypothetical protein
MASGVEVTRSMVGCILLAILKRCVASDFDCVLN